MEKELKKKKSNDLLLEEMVGKFNKELNRYFKKNKESLTNKKLIEPYFYNAQKKWDKENRMLIIYNPLYPIPKNEISFFPPALIYIGKNCGFPILHMSLFRTSEFGSGIAYHYY